MKYCNNCKQMVEPTKKWSVVFLLILLVLGILPGILYLIYVLFKAKRCPICNSTNWGKQPNTIFK